MSAERKRCLSCGDGINVAMRIQLRVWSKTKEMLTYCDECAAEKFGGKIPASTTLMHGSGGGRRVIRDPKGLG